jgi:hypothetical protein
MMNTDLFLIAFYNLHLPTEIPPPNEVKQKLTETIFRYYRISPGVIGEQNATQNYIGDFRPIAYHIPIADGRRVTIAKDYLGYQQPSDVDWWACDYPSFLEEYAHLRSFLDDYLTGKFKIKNRAWLDRVSTNVAYILTIELDKKHVAPLAVLDTPDPSREIDINRIKMNVWVDSSKRTANAGILERAYREIIDLIRTKTVHFGKCKRNGCNNIFLKSRRRKYCSDECSYEAKLGNDREGVRQEATKVYKTLCDLIDNWLKQNSRGITATELKKELKKIDSGSYKPGSIETPFLGGVTAKSLGRLLPQVEEKLKEKGILIEIKKRKKGYLYRFTRIQA